MSTGQLRPEQLRRIPIGDNTRQGTRLLGFYEICGLPEHVRGSAEREYLVLPLAMPDAPPTTAWCRPVGQP